MGKILIAGGTGLIGSILSNYLASKGNEIFILSRDKYDSEKYLSWDPSQKVLSPRCKNYQFDALINTCGADLAEKRWTKQRRKLLLESRIIPTDFLWDCIHQGKINTDCFINFSAIGIYGNNPDPVNELDLPGKSSFLVDLVKKWENAFFKNSKKSIRHSVVRSGVVISKKGGFLDRFTSMANMYVAPYFGKGNGYISWIHEEDLATSVHHIMETEQLQHVYNLTSPLPVTSKNFGKELKKTFNKNALLFPVPKFVIKILYGKMHEAILTNSQVLPLNLEEEGFKFKYENISEALQRVKES
ncbi:TIGR01777 family oxidoreductase [Membranihabitans maritimus]|uniref:TIGR01777 family oxidoreductase n=1 Tax=Membranihabitans maritimus TaxID=2904244 RepID=UPI001EFFAA27|nr:TIGR01777 family oxidoreductase [Membranihabitans maritimus]